MNRYSRHLVLPEIGEKGQKRIGNSRVVVLGLGALGSSMAESLVRCGVGHLLLVDRDFIEISNLQRQTLYTEDDIGKPKAEVAVQRLKKINSEISLTAQVVHVDSHNIEKLIKGRDIVLDATDNMRTRYIINDACVKRDIPWIYSAVLRTYGMTLNIFPKEGPCLRCLWQEKPKPGSVETCASAGILFTLPKIIANIAATETVKYVIGASPRQELLILDPWKNNYDLVEVSRRLDCDCCVHRTFPFLEIKRDLTTTLCGRDAVQVSPGEGLEIDLKQVAAQYDQAKQVGDTMVRIELERYQLSLFKDGRLIVSGTEDQNKALSLYSEYVGR